MSEFNYAKYLNPNIVEAEYTYNRAAEDLKYAVERAQETCKHEFVVYAEYQRLEYLRSMPPLLMCLQCRLEEHAADIWRDGDKAWYNGVLNPTSDTLYIKTDRDKIYKLRVEGSKIVDHQRDDD